MRIRNIRDFEFQTLEFEAMLLRYAPTKLGRAKLDAHVHSDILDRRRGKLLSANAAARIAFAKEATSALGGIAKPKRERPAFFLTLCPEFGLRRAADIWMPNVVKLGDGSTEAMSGPSATRRAVQKWAAAQMEGASYFAVTEVAFYTKHPRSEIEGPVFSFHVHAVVWDVTVEFVEARKSRIAAEHRSLLPNLPAAHSRNINAPDGVGTAMIYALKPPMQEYGAYLEGEDALDAVWMQKKRLLRPGDASRVAKVFAGVEIDALCFDGGSAATITNRIAAAARKRIRRAERREEQAFERLRLGM